MADKRKLQGDIERCLKKVTEGVEQFEDIWQKVHTASNANQKEKYEADLKKEIKKLQRLRDQIKTWLASNDIKDKVPLMDNRRLIETQMERFKVVERETKTKAYSKEGLGLAIKIDPAQKEKEDIRSWLVECIDRLNLEVDQFESQIETLHAGSKKKKVDKDKTEKVHELQEWVDKHKFHVQKVETIMRMMDNCTLDTSQVKLIRDDLNYYVECNQDFDFTENDMMYDDIDLEEVQSTVFAATVPGGSAPQQVNDALAASEETPNSIPSSPGSGQNQGPLSPKAPLIMRSTSQELFDERRKVKTFSSSSEPREDDAVAHNPQPAILASPGNPPKSLPHMNSTSSASSPSSSSSRTGGISLNKMTTPTSGKSNSLGGSTRSRNNSTSSLGGGGGGSGGGGSVSNSSSSKSNQRGSSSSKPTQLPHGHGYAVAAGGAHQQVNSHSQPPPSHPHHHNTQPNTVTSSSGGLSNAVPTTTTSGGSSSGSDGLSNSTSTSSNLSNSIDDGSGGSKESSQSQDELVHSANQQISGSQGNSQMVSSSLPSSTGQSTVNSNVIVPTQHLPPPPPQLQVHQGTHPSSLVQTSSTSQPRPVGPGSHTSQYSEHSRTDSSTSSSSLSPSTLSQDSPQPAVLALSQPTPITSYSSSSSSSSSSQPSSSGVSEPHGATPLVGGPAVPSLQTTAPISASGPPSIDTSHFSPSNQQSSALSPVISSASPIATTTTTTTTNNSASYHHPLHSPHPHPPPHHPHPHSPHQILANSLQQQKQQHLQQQQQQQQQPPPPPPPPQPLPQQQQQQVAKTMVVASGLPASSLPLHHTQPEGAAADSTGPMLMPSLLPSSAMMMTTATTVQGDFGGVLPSWMPAGMSSGVGGGGGSGGMLMGAIGVSRDESPSLDTGGVGRGLFLSSSSTGGNSLPTTSSSPLLAAVQHQSITHPSFSSNVPSAASQVTSPMSTVASSAIGMSLLQTTTASPFLSSESSTGGPGEAPTSLKAMAAQVVASTSGVGPIPHPLPSESEGFKGEPSDAGIKLGPPGSRVGGDVTTASSACTDTQLPPLLGVTPLGPIPLSQEKIYQLKMLDVAFRHLPQPSDSEKVRPYIQRTPCPTHFYHHQHPPPHFDSFEFFQRLSIETLFFVFYQMEGTKAQYMAAKALKKLSWRFHTKYMMWFQRLEEPKAITDDYEMGTYIYFDFEKWSQRKKEGFTFEYRYLEDKDLP